MFNPDDLPRPSRAAFSWAVGWCILFLVGLCLLGTVASALGWFGNWAAQPARIYSVENVREQWRFAYEGIESLEATARQACKFEAALSAATTDAERVQRQTQLLAVETNYDRIASDYNQRLRNALEGGLVRPPDVPERAPDLDTMKAVVCGGGGS